MFNKDLKRNVIYVKKTALVIAGVLIITCFFNAKMISNAANVENYNISINEEVKRNEDYYSDAFDKEIARIRKKYPCEVTVFNLEDFKAKLREMVNASDEDIEAIVSKTDDNVLRAFLLEELVNNFDLMQATSEKLNLAIENKAEVVNDDLEYVSYGGGGYRVSAMSVNEYGTKIKVSVENKEEKNSRGSFKEIYSETFPTQYITYNGELIRIMEYDYYEETLNMEFNIAFKVKYSVSDKGIKVLDVYDNGTRTTVPFCTLEYKNHKVEDPTATHEGADVDGIVNLDCKVIPGFNVGKIKISKWAPSFRSIDIQPKLKISKNSYDIC